MITPQMVLDALEDHAESDAFGPYIDVIDTLGKERDLRHVVVDGNFDLQRVAENLNRLEQQT